MEKKYIGIDLGASSGRVSAGIYNGKTIKIYEVFRFENRPVFLHETFYWDFLRLFSEAKLGILKAADKYGKKINKLGVDSWGVDFGFIGKQGKMIANPVSYRDSRTKGMIKEVLKTLTMEEIYFNSGEFIMEINTLFQLYYLSKKEPSLLKAADTMLMIPDLFNYFLTGEKFGEFSEIATTSLFDQSKSKWSDYLISKLNLPKNIFPEVIYPGEPVGKITKKLEEELNIRDLEVIATGSHDAASAVAGLPISKEYSSKKFAYIIIGTWSAVGIESGKPIINSRSFNLGFSNEGGVLGRYAFQKIISGLWLIQECRNFWNKEEGRIIAWEEVTGMAKKAGRYKNFIDVDDAIFTNKSTNIIENIKSYYNKTGQEMNLSRKNIARTIYEGLVFKYKKAIQDIEGMAGKVEIVFVTGGGSKNRLLCQWIADALGAAVITGVAETTTIGNILMQMKADGEILNIEEGRDIIAGSNKLHVLLPQNGDEWEINYRKYLKAVNA